MSDEAIDVNCDMFDSAVIANAREHLRRCRLTGIPCNTRTQATAILLGITPAPSRNEPSGIKPAPPLRRGRTLPVSAAHDWRRHECSMG
jgi:hypothetical protein